MRADVLQLTITGRHRRRGSLFCSRSLGLAPSSTAVRDDGQSSGVGCSALHSLRQEEKLFASCAAHTTGGRNTAQQCQRPCRSRALSLFWHLALFFSHLLTLARFYAMPGRGRAGQGPPFERGRGCAPCAEPALCRRADRRRHRAGVKKSWKPTRRCVQAEQLQAR